MVVYGVASFITDDNGNAFDCNEAIKQEKLSIMSISKCQRPNDGQLVSNDAILPVDTQSSLFCLVPESFR